MHAANDKHSWLKRIESRYAWSFLGAVIGAVGLILATVALRERRPEISFLILNESNVLDIHTPVASLDVLYQGESIQGHQLNLRLITLRIENTGDVDIVQGQYDQRLPWGFTVSNGRVVEIRTLNSNSSYLRTSLAPRQISPNGVAFEKVVFDRGRFILLQVLVIHRKEAAPSVVPTGKIAGMDHFTVVHATTSGGDRYLRETFGGGIFVQLLRAAAYGFAFVLAVLAIVIGILGVYSHVEAKERARRIARADRATAGTADPIRHMLADLYVARGTDGIRMLNELVSKPAVMSDLLSHHDNEVAKEKTRVVLAPEPQEDRARRIQSANYQFGDAESAADELRRRRLLTLKDDGSVIVAPELELALKDFQRGE